MPVDAPDGILIIDIGITIGGVPAGSGLAETAILETAGKVTTSSATYQTLASWTVTAAKVGILKTLELAASDYTKAQFRITIGGVVKEADWVLPASLAAEFPDTRLEPAVVVLLEGKSDGTNSIDLWGVIEGKEIG